jgi:3-oxoacyl-[acyl-carrier protein] reductase
MTHPRVALITGAGSANGIGFHSAKILTEAGHKVLLTAHSDRVHERAAELNASGYEADSLAGDLTDPVTRARLASWVRKHTDVLDALVINHGMTSVVAPTEKQVRAAQSTTRRWRCSGGR